jgi:hypothetical protein
MAEWYEVFDNEQVQFETRKRVARLGGVLVVLTVAALALAPVLAYLFDSALIAAGLAGGLLLGLVVWASRMFVQLRSVMWCVKLSVHRVVGYDYARRKSVLPWTEVERVELDDDGLLIVGAPNEGRPGRMLRIPLLFPDFAQLSHRVVEYAEAHGLPICVEGRPWQFLDLPTVYPFMAACAIVGSVERRGRTLGGQTLEGGEEA